mgnify:CR=1 FL=1
MTENDAVFPVTVALSISKLTAELELITVNPAINVRIEGSETLRCKDWLNTLVWLVSAS